jgi:hypothetical protein
MGGALLLRPDGEILCFHWDSLGELAPETDPGWRVTAVVVGAETYPELRPLLPVRPFGSADCEWCTGSGRIQIRESGRDRGPICGGCHGAGWLATVG